MITTGGTPGTAAGNARVIKIPRVYRPWHARHGWNTHFRVFGEKLAAELFDPGTPAHPGTPVPPSHPCRFPGTGILPASILHMVDTNFCRCRHQAPPPARSTAVVEFDSERRRHTRNGLPEKGVYSKSLVFTGLGTAGTGGTPILGRFGENLPLSCSMPVRRHAPAHPYLLLPVPLSYDRHPACLHLTPG
jgi:hypothetical protein